ncbi:uncharacterized protein BX663DRAFT_564777 [Cokeromyces recurvatus]|uniref:uncharacterized protein n=1 Tax=Cokeromyces recurvatus TaxID=90255 RepID=UPI002220878A|nr:uncharacterized protein BX663DRAFT_564777 [Cokeromyces recurvatus]KAI7898399.1 hypothetical protein BX663DRAFT_564777 [Cokeromyces recurvatus]
MKLFSILSLFLFSTVVVNADLSKRKHGKHSSAKDLPNYDTALAKIVHPFDGIIFGSFVAEPDTQRFNGSLAIQGNFTASNFIVNSRHKSSKCNKHGLVVGGISDATNTVVNGDYSIASGDTTGIISNCSNTHINVNFKRLYKKALQISQSLAKMKPNMVIRHGGYLSDGEFLGKSKQNYYVFTFNKCKQKKHCVLPDYLYSTSKQIFLGGNWTGPYNSPYSTDKPIVFNIPIPSNTVFNMSTPNPAAGLKHANVIYNVYPVTETGAYDPQGRFVWLRNTTHRLNGYALAPSAYVVENNLGGFRDKLIASRYFSAQDLDAMFFIKNSTFTQH